MPIGSIRWFGLDEHDCAYEVLPNRLWAESQDDVEEED